jgi:hypothetical protein
MDRKNKTPRLILLTVTWILILLSTQTVEGIYNDTNSSKDAVLTLDFSRTGRTVYDKDGKYIGEIFGASWIDGIGKSALSFDGIDDYANVSNKNYFYNEGKFSLQVCFKTGYSQQWEWLVAGSGGSWFGINRAGWLTWKVNVNTPYSSSAFVADNLWHSGVVTFDNGNLKLYNDGLLVGNWNRAGLKNTTGQIFIGQNGYNKEYFDGVIDEVRIYKRVLNAEEIKISCNEEKPSMYLRMWQGLMNQYRLIMALFLIFLVAVIIWKKPKPSKQQIRNILYLLTCIIIAAIVFYRMLLDPGVDLYYNDHALSMIYGTGEKPFVYRTLVPTFVRTIVTSIPKEIRLPISRSLSTNTLINQFFNGIRLACPADNTLDFILVLTLMYLSLFGFLFAFQYLFSSLFKAPKVYGYLLSLFAIFSLPPLLIKYPLHIFKVHNNDLTTLFLFTLSLALMYRAKWLDFIVVYTLSCFNKESTILLTLLFIIQFYKKDKMERTLFKKLLLAQIIIFSSIKFGLFLFFKDNPGAFFEFHLFDYNIPILKDILNTYSLSTVITLITVFVLIFYKWSEKPLFLKNAFWATLPLLPITLFVGVIDEKRVFLEIYPTIVLLIFHTIYQVMGADISNNTPSGDPRM